MASVILIAAHAAAHKRLVEIFAEKFKLGQIVVMCPGYVGAVWNLRKILKMAWQV